MWFVFGASMLLGFINFFYLIPPVVNWDEGTHAIWGFREWLALRDGNLGAFWQFTRQQFAYPPLGSWLIALVNFPFEFSITLSRFVSTIGFILSAVLVYLIGKQLNNKKLSGLIAFLFFVTSPIILFYSVVVFKEIWGVVLTLLTLFLYLRAHDKKTYFSYFLAGLSLIFLFWEKYNYALLVLLIFFLEDIVDWVVVSTVIRSKKGLVLARKTLVRHLLIFTPVSLFALWWIFTPEDKSLWFLDIMRSDWNPVTVGLGGQLEYLLFYPNSIRVSYVFSEVLFWILVAGYLLSLRELANKKVRVLFLLFTLNLVLGTRHAINLQDRYILTTVPALFLLTGYQTEKIYPLVKEKIKNQKSKLKKYLRIFIFTFLFLILGSDLVKLPWFLKSNTTHLLSSAMYHETDYHDTIFNFNKNDWPKGELFLRKEAETPEQVIDYVLDNVDVNSRVEIVGYTSEMSPDWIELRMALKRRECVIKNLSCLKTGAYYLVTIEVKPTSRIYTYDYKRANSWALPKIKQIEIDSKSALRKEKEFKELGVVVKIYEF